MRRPIVLGLLFLAACGEPEPPALTVGPIAYASADLLGLSQDRRESLGLLAGFALAVADSSTRELGAPRIGAWEEERLLEILAAELVLEKNQVSDDVLEARYLTDPEYELTVRHILFFSERWRTAVERDAAREKAERAVEALKAGADFAETAARLSEEPGAEGRQGLLTPGRRGAWVDEFWAAASALEPGEISPVTETQYGFHILRLEGKAIVPFAESRSRIAREIADRIEDPRAVLEAWMEERASSGEAEAARESALEEARTRGLRVPDGERAELERFWDDQVYRWSTALGFQQGMSTAQAAAAAREALARTGQGANIARTELEAEADLIQARYSIHVAPAG